MIYLGVDPGFDGALCALDQDGKIIALWDTPTISIKTAKGKGHRRQYDISKMWRDIPYAGFTNEMFAVIEEAQAMPRQGMRSTFACGLGMGIWLGILSTIGIPYQRVRPHVWKKAMGLDSDKEKTRLRAIEQFPLADLHRRRDHNRAEALFLAKYAMLKMAVRLGEKQAEIAPA